MTPLFLVRKVTYYMINIYYHSLMECSKHSRMQQKTLNSTNSSTVTSTVSRNFGEKLKLNLSHSDCDYVGLGRYCMLRGRFELC